MTSAMVIAAEGEATFAPPESLRVAAGAGEPHTDPIITKADIVAGSELARHLARVKGDDHQDGVLLDLWPYVFMSRDNQEYIHFLRERTLLFATRYVGARDREPGLMRELLEYCRESGLELCYLDMSNRRKLELEEQCGLLSTPLGVVQTIDDMSSFSLAGTKMRRLRYVVERFKKSGAIRVLEYTQPNAGVDREIRRVMLAWTREKGVVNKVDAILADMRSGNLLKRYRVYLTYLGDALQNVIILSHIGDGYITDQEYYVPEMPLGGTEHAYVEIMKTLAAEGCKKFSLGLTWGLFEPKEGFSDREGWNLISKTEGQLAQILQRGAQNHQYKNKYCPTEYPLYLYRAPSSRPQIIKQCMGQFFRSGVAYEAIRQQIELDQREVCAVTDAAFDPTRVKRSAIRLDLMTDSWSHLTYDFVRNRARALAELLGGPEHDEGTASQFFGKQHGLLTTSGRCAERVFFQTFRSGGKKLVLQNVPFFSTLHNLVKAGFESVEIPRGAIHVPDSDELFRGGVDLPALRQQLEARSGEIALTFIELCNNASGGYPVSLAQLGAIAEACRLRHVPLVIDVTRIVKNAELIRRHEAGQAQRGLWDIVADITRLADVVIGSLCKEFGLTSGGILAADDEKMLLTARRYAEIEGAALDEVQSTLVCRALQDTRFVQENVRAQLDLVTRLHEELVRRQVPIILPGAGHCVLLRVRELPDFASLAYPGESLLRVLLERYGVRAGVHFTAGQKDGLLPGCIRLAVPLGLRDERLVPQLADVLAAVGSGGSASRCETLDFMRCGASEEPRVARPALGRAAAPRQSRDADIAVIGLSGRYARAGDVSALWANLMQRHCAISEVPQQRWDWKEHFHPDPEVAPRLGKSYGKWGAFLETFDQFDPLFFWMAPRRVGLIDPQERLFLEECWKALEDAGYPPAALTPRVRERTGVFGGMSKQGYGLYAAEVKGAYPYTSLASLVGRVSHFFDFKGPSLPVENHCASGLVAVHEACEYLRQGKGELALAGGVSLSLHPSSYVHLSLVGMLSRDARSAAFGKGGVGYVPGEGVGVVVLKSLARAIEDRDPIYAVIRGGAVNHNGRMRYYGEPSERQQEAVIRAALSQAEVEPGTIGYIEAAAAGVETSDAVEMAALSRVFGDSRRGPLYALGSLKPNIGHCEAVSGMSQLTKVILSLQHGMRAPTLVPDEPNPRVEFEHLPFELQREASAWERVRIGGSEVPRRAGVTALGNGINAHLVLEEYGGDEQPALALRTEHRPGVAAADEKPMLFVLSAQNKERLKSYARRWVEFLESGPLDMARVVHSLQVGREPMPCRLAISTSNQAHLTSRLRAWCEDDGGGEQVRYGDKRCLRIENEARILAALDARRLEELAELWTAGNAIPWQRSCEPPRTRRSGGLPSYPFAPERYWFNGAPSAAG